MRLYTYVIQHDNGYAPNYEPPLCTLGLCKPRIRSASGVGNAVLAFTGSDLGREPHAVCWAGVIKKKLTFHDYWDHPDFQGKKLGKSRTPDNIYEPIGTEMRQVSGGYHDSDEARRTDLGGRYVLVFAQSWRFGAAGPILPDEFGLRMRGGRRNHRVHELSEVAWKELREWLDSQRRGTSAPRRRSNCAQAR
jgi:hypothetical protein